MTTPAEPVDVILADGGVITSTDVQRLLRFEGILLRRVRFEAADPQEVCTVPWTGTRVDDKPLHGTLSLHVDPGGRHVVIEGKLHVPGDVVRQPARPGTFDEPRGLYAREAQALELLARDGLRQAVEQPTNVAALVPYLAKIVDLLEGGEADERG